MSTSCAENLAVHYGQRLIDGAITEVGYFCCFNTYATKFEKAKRQLIGERKGVEDDIEDASKRDETRVEKVVEQWIEDADAVIKEETETRQECFYGLCSDCIWQYQHGKEFKEKTEDITKLLERRLQFTRVARPSKNSAIKFYAPPIFIDFKSRKSKFKELVEALENGNYNVIGLQGLVGMGKTTLAIQVGLHVDQSDSFEEVIFTPVPNPPDINKIRREIAGQLKFPLEGDEEQHSKALWFRITNSKGKVLIILDDVWEKLELKDIGIPHNHSNCRVLITTHDSKVCEHMGCQPTVSLDKLKDRDGLDIFIKHVGTRSEVSTSKFMDLAQEIINVCGGLPLAIVAIATMLKGFHISQWKNVLEPLHNSGPLQNDYRDWMKVRSSLKLSYDKLENKAKDLLLLCSLFPKDYEIPIEFLSKLGIGLGLFGEVKNYSRLREKLILVKNDLIKSFLLLETKEACVKMHDLVRALLIEDKDVQVIMNSSGELKSNLKFLSWSSNGFPNHFDGTKLKVLLLWIKGAVRVDDSYATFEKMLNLRVLFLRCDKDVVYPTFSLQSFLSLKNIRTLILNGWRLGDISILKHLNNLVTLEFENCLIMDLPIEIVQVDNLRLLGIRKCRVERKNAFEVIGRCSRLEELYFVENDDIDPKPKDDEENKGEFAHGKSHPALQKYSVACSGLQCFVNDDNGIHKCFNTKHVKNLMSEEMFKYLVEEAEILELGDMGEARWKSLVPDIIPKKDAVMKDLIKLCLDHCADIECLLDNREPLGDVGVFSDLAELHLVGVNVKDLYRGRMPSSFLSQLRIFKLLRCKKLCNNFFYGNLKLPQLKVLQLDDCPMFKASIFRPSVALSLAQLEELSIKDCEQVETLIEYQSPREEVVDADHQNSDGFLFPKLKSLKIQGCGKLQLVLSFLLAGDLCLLEDLSIRSCEKLEYIFGEYQDEGQVLLKKNMLPSLTRMELEAVPSFIKICKACTKCMQRASPTQKHANSKTHASTRAHGCCCLPSSSSEPLKRNETSHPADRRSLRQSSMLGNIREMTLMEWPSLKHINLGRELVKRPFPHSMVCLQGRQLTLETGDQESIRRPCPDLMSWLRGRPPNWDAGADTMKLLKDMENLASLGIRYSEIEEIFNLEGLESEGNLTLKLQVLEIKGLHKLRYIYKDPNNILNLCNLEVLVFSECDQLRAIFSTSTMKLLPRLSHLEATQCRELVYIIEDDGGPHQLSFPKLQKVLISHCNKLKSLFSISTLSKLQELQRLEIEEAFNLEEVFGCRQDDTRERGLEDVVPKLSHFKLKNLPNLGSFCRGIDFQSVRKFVPGFKDVDCAILEQQKELKKSQEIKDPPSTHSNTRQAMLHTSDVGTSTQVQTHTGEAKGKQEINSAEDFEQEPKKTGYKVPFPETSAMKKVIEEVAIEQKQKHKLAMAFTIGIIDGTEETKKTQANGPTPALKEKASDTSPAESKLTSPHSNEAILNGGVQGDLNSKDDEVATPLPDDGALMNALATMVTPGQDLMKIKPRNETIMTLPQEMGEMRTVKYTTSKVQGFKDHNKTSDSLRFFKDQNKRSVTERIPEDIAIMKSKVVPPSTDSKVGGSQSDQTTPTNEKTRYARDQEGPKLEKATKANLPHVNPSYYQGRSSQILGISEILEVMELKDGEPALLAKALELYPQLRLSREQRTRRVIAFSYRVLIDILLMLATKTPSTITASDKLTLREKLDAATYFGFEKDWIQSVRAKVFGNDKFDVLTTREEILVKKAKLETYRTTLEQVQNQRTEAIERLAEARRLLDFVQSELEVIDSRLFGQLEERKKLIIDMMKFREIIRAKYRPIGI